MNVRIRLAVIVAALLSLLAPAMTLAATTTATVATPAATQTQPGEGLQLQPPLITTQADPGSTVVLNIKIRNISSGTLRITAVANDFGAKGEDGSPAIFLDETTTTRYSLKQWIAGIPQFTLASQADQTIPVKVVVPINAEPGGHYAVIRFSGAVPSLNGASDDSSASGNLGLNASIGALVLFTVNGNIKQHLSPVDVAVTNAKGQRHKLFEKGPVKLVERIKNDGNVHEAPTGTVVVKNIFGKTTATLAFNTKKGNILPDAIRKFSQDLNKKNLFGRYTVKSSVTYDNGKALTFPSTSFWVIPYTLLAIVLVVLILLFFIFRFGLKRYNDHIIAQARRR